MGEKLTKLKTDIRFGRIKSFNPWNLLKNLTYLSKYDYKSELRATQEELSSVNSRLRHTQLELLYLKILKHFQNHPNDAYRQELLFLREIGAVALFPYHRLDTLRSVICQLDPDKGLPYVIHRKDKKLYFPKEWSLVQVKDMYISLVEEQGILGGNYYEKAPHQYQTDVFKIEQSDVVLDIGAAEGLFTLDNIDEARKAYIFESDHLWIEALKATFEPYQDKVVLINKFVSDINTEHQITLTSCLADEEGSNLFIKIDIEGDEIKVLKGNRDFLTKFSSIKIACCTYHNNEDANCIQNILNEYGFSTSFSDGYMIFVHDENIKPPYFRRGVIRGSRVEGISIFATFD